MNRLSLTVNYLIRHLTSHVFRRSYELLSHMREPHSNTCSSPHKRHSGKKCRLWRKPLMLSVGLVLLLQACSPPLPPDSNASTPSQREPEPNSSSQDRQSQNVFTLDEGQMLPITAEATIQDNIILLEIAQTPRQQAIGLMFRDDLPDNQGMLFPFSPPRPVQFWMRNVQFPLDMLFLYDGEIKAIAPSVPPCITQTCPTYGPEGAVDYVLELKGGQADALGLSIGDSVNIRYIDPIEPESI